MVPSRGCLRTNDPDRWLDHRPSMRGETPMPIGARNGPTAAAPHLRAAEERVPKSMPPRVGCESGLRVAGGRSVIQGGGSPFRPARQRDVCEGDR